MAPPNSSMPPEFERMDEVLACAEAFALGHAASGEQRESFRMALRCLRACMDGWRSGPSNTGWAPFVSVPLLVYGGCAGDVRSAVPLAAATSLLFLGLDLFDDIADGDQREEWLGYRTSEVNLVAATLLCSLPQLAIAELEAPAAVRAEMQRTLASGLLKMGAGQQRDLTSTGAGFVRSAAMVASVVQKSGEEVAMFARLAAQLGQSPPDAMEAYEELGRSIGTAGQLSSDCYELFDDPAARDLAHGSRTLPIALHLERLSDRERAVFTDLLERARHDEAAREEVRDELRRHGVLRICAFMVETYCQRALRMLERANPLEPARSGLSAMINQVSFFSGRATAKFPGEDGLRLAELHGVAG